MSVEDIYCRQGHEEAGETAQGGAVIWPMTTGSRC